MIARRTPASGYRPARARVLSTGLLAVALALPAALAIVLPAASAQAEEEFPVTGKIKIIVDPEEPVLTTVSRWGWFPREEYPFDRLGSDEGPDIHPDLLTAWVNFGCHFEGWVRWRYEELEVELLDDGRVRRRLELTRQEQGGFYNNDLKFKCEIATKHRRVNELLGTLLTMGEAPAGGFQSSLVQVVWLRMLQTINTLPRTDGTWGDYLYDTFKSFMTLNAMDDDVAEVDLYFSPDGDMLEFEIEGERTAIFER